MRFLRILTVCASAAVLWPTSARGQSVERAIERWAQSIAANAERLAARIEREANLWARDFERRMEDRHGKSGHDRDHDQGRDLQGQATRIDTTFAFNASGIVDLTSINGDIVVTGWDRREARVRASVDRGRMEFDLTSSRITIEQRSDRGNLARSQSSDTQYEVSIPRGVRVMTRSRSGDIRISGTGGDVEANTSNGDIDIRDAAGRIEAGTLSGEITVSQIKGNVDVSTVTGSITVSQLEGDVHAASTGGDITVADVTGRDIELSTTRGDIDFRGSIDAAGRYELTTHAGDVLVAIPEATNARVVVGTFSGEIDSDFPITLMPGDRSGRTSRRFEFTIGSGGPRIVAESFSGDVEIRKR
jgi:DUF4097 and DUF4098 domain-containing protein YvlB